MSDFPRREGRRFKVRPSSVNATGQNSSEKVGGPDIRAHAQSGRLNRIRARGGVIVRRVVHAPALAPKKGFASIETRMRALPTRCSLAFSDDSSAFCVHTTQKPRVEGARTRPCIHAASAPWPRSEPEQSPNHTMVSVNRSSREPYTAPPNPLLITTRQASKQALAGLNTFLPPKPKLMAPHAAAAWRFGSI